MPKIFDSSLKNICIAFFYCLMVSSPSFGQNKCIDLGTGIGVSNDEMAFINFFKDGGKWEPVGSNNHPWYKVNSLDSFKVVNGAYYNWDADWSGTINNEAWGNDWADCFISFWDMMVDQGKIRQDGYPTGFPVTVYKYKPKFVDANQGVDLTKPVPITQFMRRIYFPTGLTQNGWILRWKGKGKISYEGIEVNSANVPYSDNGSSWTADGNYAGRNYTFTSTSGGRVVNKHYWMVHGWRLNILESDPADPIRDIEYLYPGQEASYDAGQRFTPQFLERMKQFKCLRYMGYLNANGIQSRKVMSSTNPFATTDMVAWLRWDERTPDHYYQINNGNGGNYETIIDLANQTGTDAWVNIPYCANEAYTDSLVRLFMEKLNPDRTLYLEVGNELWNYAPGFDGYFWQARIRTREFPGLGDVEARGAFINRIFKQVTLTAGVRNLPRIQRVFAGFPRYYDVNNRTSKMIQPDYWDALATTWYFGLDENSSTSNACKDPQSGTNWRTVLYNWYLAHPTDQTGFNQTYRNCVLKEFRCNGSYRNNVDAVLAKYYNKKLVCYEGGNHTFYGCTNGPTGNALTGELEFNTPVFPDYYSNNGFINAVCKADESVEIGKVFNEVIDSLQAAGITLANHLSFSGRSTCYGVWDLIQSRDIEASLPSLLSNYAKFKVFSDRISSDNCNKVNITLAADTVGPGLSILLDGINDYIDGQVTYIPDESANYTMETWIKPNFLDKDQVILSFSSDGTNDWYNTIKVRADKKIVWEIGNNGLFSAKLLGIELETDKWYHVAATRNGSRYTLYVNGVNVASNNFTLPVNTRNHFTIGGVYHGAICGNFFGGEIDEVRLWNAARSVEDIRSYMCKKINSGDAQFSSLRAYYQFNAPDYTSFTLYDQVTKTANGHLRNITITERSRYAVSGAPIGDYSNYIYPASWSGTSLSLTHPQGDRTAVYNIAGTLPAGIQIYMIDGKSHFNDLPLYYTDISNKRVVGVFLANGNNATYDISYMYAGNQDVSSGGGADNLRLLRRSDYSTDYWLHAGAQHEAVAKTLTVSCKDKYRAEYTLAHRPTLKNIRPGSGKALLDNQTPTGNVMGKVQYLDLNDYTVTFWAKGWGEVFDFTSKLKANGNSFTIYNAGSNQVSCGLRYGVHWTYDVSFNTSATGLNNEWHHYAVSKNGSKIRIYIDGMEMTSGDVTSTFPIQEMYLFNAPSWQSGNFQGGKANLTLDEFTVWNKALDQNTIRNWMCKKITASHPDECKNLVLYFNFDENQGTVLEDKRGPSDIVLTTDGSGFQWVASGAALGDESIADYTSPENVSLSHSDGDYLEANRTSGSAYGAHLYRINNKIPEPSQSNSAAILSLDSSRYWGLFVAKPVGTIPAYEIINHYEKNTKVIAGNETQLRMLSRTDNATVPWLGNTTSMPNTTLHTLTLNSQSRGEYILGGTDAQTFLKNTVPVLPVFLPSTLTLNIKTICGNSTGLKYKVQQDPNALSYSWTLPPELNGYSVSDSIFLNTRYNGTVSKTVDISVVAINASGQSAMAIYTITLLPSPTTSDAGPDQIRIPPVNNSIMAANSPSATEVGLWSKTSGTGNITNTNNPTTTITAIGSGINRFTWNIDNTVCPISTDTMQILLAPAPNNILLQNGNPLPLILCEGEVLTIRAIPPEDILPDNYLWTMPTGITLLSQTGTEAVIQIGNGIGGSIQVAALYNGVASLPYHSTAININLQPTRPVFVNKPSTLCLNVDAAISIEYKATADSVAWILPYGIYPVEYPKSTNENITIQAIDVTTGYIKARIFNHGCTNTSAIDSFNVIVKQAPAKPVLFLGDDGNQADAVCGNANALLWVRNNDKNINYEWKWNTGVDFVKYFNDNHSGAMFTIHNENSSVLVRAVQSTGVCKTSEWFDFYAWPQSQGPAQITSVSISNPVGQNAMNLQVGQTYTFKATGTGDYYYWDLPVGFELISDGNDADNSNTIRLNASGAGYLMVYPITLKGCSGVPFTLNVGSTGALLPPAYVSGNTEICQNSKLNITISAVTGATGYTWTMPDGTFFKTTSPVLNETINSPMQGKMLVIANNATSHSTALELTVLISPIFLSKTGFVDENNKPILELEICSGASRLPVYHASNTATTYSWAIHGTAIAFDPRWEAGHENDSNYELLNRTSPTDTLMSVSWDSWRCKNDGTDGGYIVVTTSNLCGGPSVKDSLHYYWSQPLSILVPEYTKSPTSACVGSKINFEIHAIPNATQYVWKLPNGLVASDAVTSTPSITADVVNGTGGIVTVMALGSTCGGSQTIEQPGNPITISGSPLNFHFIDQPQAACFGETLTYSVNDIGAASYIWTLPEGFGATVLDDQDVPGVSIVGSWNNQSRANMIHGAYHSATNDNASKRIIYTPTLPYTGKYRVSLSYFTNWNNRTDVPVIINSVDGTFSKIVNMQITPSNGIWQELGEYNFNAGITGSVSIGSNGTGGNISIADAVKFEVISISDDASISIIANGNVGGALCVSVNVPQCTSEYTICTNPINMAGELAAPQFAVQENSICQGLTYTFRATDIGADSYTWHLPAGMSIGGLTGDVPNLGREVIVRMDLNTGSPVKIGVHGIISSCSIISDITYTNPILFNGVGCKLSTPLFLLQPTGICIGSNATYSITAVQYAEKYEWYIPNGLRQISTMATGKIKTTSPSITLEPTGAPIGNLGTMYVKALSTIITNGDSVVSTPITVSSTPVFTVAFTDITQCNANDGTIQLSGLVSNASYSVSYTMNAIPFGPANRTTDASGNLNIPNLATGTYDHINVGLTGCSTTNTATHTIVTPPTVQITNVVYHNPLTCGSNGSIAIVVPGAIQNSTYGIDYNNNGSTDTNVIVNKDTISITGLPAGFTLNQLAIIDPNTQCRSSFNTKGIITDPSAVKVASLNFQSADTCGGNGKIQISLTGANNNSLFNIDFENDGVTNTTATCTSNHLVLNNVPTNTVVTSLAITETATGCRTISGLSGVFTPIPLAQISKVDILNATQCSGTGAVRITTVGTANGATYAIHLNNDAIPEGTVTVLNDTLTLSGLTIGTAVTGIKIQNTITHCTASFTTSGIISQPAIPKVKLTLPSAMCSNEKAQTLQGGSPAGGTYLIDKNIATTITPGMLSAGNHMVKYIYTDNNLCSGGDSLQITINNIPETTITGENGGCPPSGIVPYATTYNSSCQYQWDVTGATFTAGNNDAQINVNWNNATTGTIRLIAVESLTACTDTSLLSVNFADIESPTLTGCLSEYHVPALIGENGIYYIFNNSDSLCIPKETDNCTINKFNITFSTSDNTEHQRAEFTGFKMQKTDKNNLRWTITDKQGNSSECSINIIFDLDETAPTAFSPNGDQHNDTWEIDFLKEYPDCIVKVYSRLGMLVYQSEKGYPVNWDGKSNGNLLPLDTYYYIIAIGNKVIKGYVTIVY